MHYKKLQISFLLLLLFSPVFAVSNLSIAIEKDEYWWLGIVSQGYLQPLEDGFEANLFGNLYGNQAQPLLLSNTGKIIWSDDPFEISVSHDSLNLSKSSGTFVYKKVATNLKDAYLYASKNFFPPSGTMPNETMFAKPQYNTWIELLYNQNQVDVLNYANGIIRNGLPAGVIMIDDNWQEDYGKWNFHPERFPNPKLMIDSLHHMGFEVMLWVCPFISPDSDIGRMLESKNLLLKTTSGETKIVHWWNGYSTVLDFTNPLAMDWFKENLNHLMDEYGIDGYKFDAGDPEYYLDGVASENVNPNRHSELFAKIGTEYSFNEYRATWKMGGQPLAQRLRDKGHTWNDLQTLIPDILLQGIMGYPFTCPDMIGGGEMGSFADLAKINQNLIVRSAQIHAFMPMMQFSVAPWRVLDDIHFAAVKQAVKLRMQHIDLILDLARKSAQSGEPVVRYMEYEFPDGKYEKITDQFMLGSNLLIAPFLDQSEFRNVTIPKGTWKDDKGVIIEGPRIIQVKSELLRIPFYERIE